MNLYLPVLGIMITFISCSNNRLKMNEKGLRESIIVQEKAESENVREESGHDTLNPPSAAFRFKENRQPDPLHPPVMIDIAGNPGPTLNMKLSDIAHEITYIRMEPIPDTTIPSDKSLPSDLKFKYHITDNYIIAANIFGIHLYSRTGKYLRQVVKNEMTGVVIKPGVVAFYNDFTLKGGGMGIRSRGDIIYYTYSNTMTGENYIMRLDCSSAPLTEEYRFDPENPDRISGLGEIALDLNHGNSKPPAQQGRQGMFGGSPDWLYYEKDAFILDNNNYVVPSTGDRLVTIQNFSGDTLTSFSRFEKLVNYSKSLKRGTDDGVYYEYKESLLVRPEYNDTVFRVMSPDRLLPVYVINLGKYKVSMQEGVDPDFDLTGRIIPEEWAETDKFIFLTYTMDNYDCPDNRRKKNVKIYHALYTKQNLTFSVIKGNPFDYSPEILENDIDGGVPVWPSFYMIGKNNEILIPLKGKDLKERVKSEYFKQSKAPDGKKLELEKLAGQVSDPEDILMIIN